MASWPILSVTTFLPLVGALFIMLMGGEDEAVKRNARWVARCGRRSSRSPCRS